MAYSQYHEHITQFEQNITTMVQLIQQNEPQVLYQKPSEHEWSVMQIASHVVEAVQFWVVDLQALLIVPNAKWGRNHEHVRRLAAVDEQVVKAISIEDISTSLNALIPTVKQALSLVEETHLDNIAPSYNPNFDQKPLSFLINHLIIQHIASHKGQMERHLAKVLAAKN